MRSREEADEKGRRRKRGKKKERPRATISEINAPPSFKIKNIDGVTCAGRRMKESAAITVYTLTKVNCFLELDNGFKGNS